MSHVLANTGPPIASRSTGQSVVRKEDRRLVTGHGRYVDDVQQAGEGMGEGGAIGSHAAVANAIGDAVAPLGATVTATPLGPSQILDLVQAAPS